ncbi:costars family protein ABRACL isoform X1 [Latimeria chalumnae]|uniref:costars family protein ABRACL isoform X1 n=1 Tax=Latimeria chalumnae TaxID=7897 RepID=UPI00313C4137
MDVDNEIELLVTEICRLGTRNQDTEERKNRQWRKALGSQGQRSTHSSRVFYNDYADGKISVKFGVLFADEKCANLFEALVGTLRAAKKRKIITYEGQLLLQGTHDDVDIVLLR